MSEKVEKVEKENHRKSFHKYICNTCNYICSIKSYYTKHLNSAKHKKMSVCEKVEKVEKKITEKVAKKYVCECCNYSTLKKTDYTKHLNTSKHKKIIDNVNIPENNITTDPSCNEIKVLTNLVVELVKSNNDLQKQMIDVCQKIQPNNTNSHNTNSHNTNSHNKTFNLQFFLNEECKDAMNLSEFVNSIQLKLSDLENIGKLGYVDGISNIIIKELNETEINKRPVHCSDIKRETLYVKEENKWEKDTDDTKQMVKAVRDVDKKASKLLMTDWKDANPDLTNSRSNQNKQFIKLVGEVNDGDESNVKKVIKKVAKQVVIEK